MTTRRRASLRPGVGRGDQSRPAGSSCSTTTGTTSGPASRRRPTSIWLVPPGSRCSAARSTSAFLPSPLTALSAPAFRGARNCATSPRPAGASGHRPDGRAGRSARHRPVAGSRLWERSSPRPMGAVGCAPRGEAAPAGSDQAAAGTPQRERDRSGRTRVRGTPEDASDIEWVIAQLACLGRDHGFEPQSPNLTLPVLPLDDEVVLPGMVVPLDLTDSEVRAAVEAAQLRAHPAAAASPGCCWSRGWTESTRRSAPSAPSSRSAGSPTAIPAR